MSVDELDKTFWARLRGRPPAGLSDAASHRSKRLAHFAIDTEERKQSRHAVNNSQLKHSEPNERGAVAMTDSVRLNYFCRNRG